MSPLYLKDGKLLLAGNSLAGSPDCCCGGACCLPGGCLFQSDAIWSGDEPEAIPGYTKIPGGWQRLYVDGDCIALNENSQMNQDWFNAVLGVDPDAMPISGNWEQVAPSCEAAESQLACEEQGGTYHAGQTCAEEPCCCGTPLAPPFPECADTQEILWLQCTNFCDECTCEQVAQAGQYDSCISDIEAILEQQGYSGVAYDEYAATAPDGCGQGQYLYGRDLIACCPGEISGLISDAVPWRAAWDGEPCQWCGILSGAFVKDGTIYVQKCVNPLP